MSGFRKIRGGGKPSFLSSRKNKMKRLLDKSINYLEDLIFNPDTFFVSGCYVMVIEVVVCIFIISNVAYTEIDWRAYMQEVEGFLNGSFDYAELKGDTGPLVYPAGFVYIYSVLYYLTDTGYDLKRAQFIFAGFYLLTLFFVVKIYQQTKVVPPFVLIFMCGLAYRIHSIFVLRMFNDGIAMLICYASIWLFSKKNWLLGCVLYSLAVSVKMNALLFAPGLLIILIVSLGYWQASIHLSVCAIIQIILGTPFLYHHPISYIVQSFNFGRQFMFKWTVNWRFLGSELFNNRYLHVALLAAHLVFLAAFAFRFWLKAKGGLLSCLRKPKMDLSAQEIVHILFTSNFIGMMFSRTLHYQFYVWYFHTLPFLLWRCRASIILRLTILGVIEYCWNVYPSTNLSSALLHLCHWSIFVGLVLYERFGPIATPKHSSLKFDKIATKHD